MGSSADPEVDGSSAGGNATADDNTNQDDEDGVTFGTLGSGELDRGISNPISITASVPGYVNLWIDLDGDGNWQANERLLADTSVAAGTQSLNVAIPLNINTGQRFARIRYTTDDPQGALGPGGDWPNGEVEDYAVDITSLTARLDATKTVAIFDPFSQGLFHIPQNDVTYTIVVENIGDTPTDSGSIFLVDRLPPEVSFFNGDANGPGPGTGNIVFSTTSPSVTFNPATDVRFSDAGFPPVNFSDCNHNPSSGYDPAVRFICIAPGGQLPNGTSGPSFSVTFRARIN